MRARISPIILFFIISFIGIIGFFLICYSKGDTVYLWLAQENDTSIRFIDYDMHFYYARFRDNLYQTAIDIQGCFPPFAYMMYYFFVRLTFSKELVNNNFDSADIVFLYYSIAVAIIIYIAINMYDNSRVIGTLTFIALMLSAPFIGGGFQVGNSAMLTVGLMLMAYKLLYADGTVSREIGLALIAVCAGIKIYPAAMGLLLLKEKRFKEAARLVVYGIIIILVPFLFFGRVQGFLAWMDNIISTMGNVSYGRIQSIKGLSFTVLTKIGAMDSMGFLVSALPIIFLATMIILALLSRNKYHTVFFIMSMIALFPNNSYRYTVAYFAIPLVMYIMDNFNNEKSRDIFSFVEMGLYGMIFTIPVWWGFSTHFELLFKTYTLTYLEMYIYTFVYILVAYISVLEIIDIIKRGKSNDKKLFENREI